MTTATYVYDPLGRRVKKTVNSVDTYYLSDGVEEVLELSSAGAIQNRYVYGPGIDEPILMYAGSGMSSSARHYYRADAQGTIVATIESDGDIRDQYTYDAYGNPDQAGGNAIRYTGRRWDAETGLYYYRARYYSPALGRFLQTDPVGYEADMNMYGYVFNDPMNNTDPTGEMPPDHMDPSKDMASIRGAYYYNNPDEALGDALIMASVIPGGLVVRGVVWGARTLRAAVVSHRAAQATARSAQLMEKARKIARVEKGKKTEQVGRFSKSTKTIPGKGRGQSRLEIENVKNAEGRVIRTRNMAFDRANRFQGKKPSRGGPEGRKPDGSMPDGSSPTKIMGVTNVSGRIASEIIKDRNDCIDTEGADCQ